MAQLAAMPNANDDNLIPLRKHRVSNYIGCPSKRHNQFTQSRTAEGRPRSESVSRDCTASRRTAVARIAAAVSLSARNRRSRSISDAAARATRTFTAGAVLAAATRSMSPSFASSSQLHPRAHLHGCARIRRAGQRPPPKLVATRDPRLPPDARLDQRSMPPHWQQNRQAIGVLKCRVRPRAPEAPRLCAGQLRSSAFLSPLANFMPIEAICLRAKKKSWTR